MPVTGTGQGEAHQDAQGKQWEWNRWNNDTETSYTSLTWANVRGATLPGLLRLPSPGMLRPVASSTARRDAGVESGLAKL
jgi:hypothetical protein